MKAYYIGYKGYVFGEITLYGEIVAMRETKNFLIISVRAENGSTHLTRI